MDIELITSLGGVKRHKSRRGSYSPFAPLVGLFANYSNQKLSTAAIHV